MKIIMKFKFNFFILLIYSSFSLSFNIDSTISKVFKDSIDFKLIQSNAIKTKFRNNPDYIFLDALIEFNGDSASKKYQDFYSSADAGLDYIWESERFVTFGAEDKDFDTGD